MRTIIFLQALIIIGGAYYIYTIRQAPAPADTNIEVRVVPEVAPEPEVAAQTSAEQTESEASSPPSLISGPSDVGMEFPIPDDESVLQGE